jgi:hypothetical protein
MPQVQTQPYNRAFAITKSDTVNLDGTTYSANPTGGGKPIPCEAIFVGTGGTMTVVFEDGSTAAFTVATGGLLPVKAIRVNSTGTAAALMVALYTV